MTTTIPSYLRVHRGPERAPATLPCSDRDPVEAFWTGFADVTGWRIDKRSKRLSGPLQVIPATGGLSMDGIETETVAAVSKSAATRLANSATQLTGELRAARRALRRQEAELAARAVILAGAESQTKLIDRIEATLADAAIASGCSAAVLYLLDDDTESLKARASYGMSPCTIEAPPRPLRGSRGDLEAMVRGVVTIDDFQATSIDTWNSPEPFACGICVAITNCDVPIGTLWLFGSEPTEFGPAAEAVARLAATQLATELSHASLDQDQVDARAKAKSLGEVARYQHDALPVGALLAEHWRVDGMVESPSNWATGWHLWDVLPDGTLMLAIAEAVDRTLAGAMHATVARAALTSHCGYRHTPAQLMQRVSDTLWQTSTGEQLMSLLYARVDPETGAGELATAGTITALIGSRFGYRPLVDGSSEPLNSHIDSRCVSQTFRLSSGETLLAYTQGVTLAGASQSTLGDRIRTCMQSNDPSPLAAIRRDLIGLPLQSERGAVSLLRL